LLPSLDPADKVVVMKMSWLIVAAVVIALCNVANAPDALACGAPGQFGGCLAHGQFDSSGNASFAGLDSQFHQDTHRVGNVHWYKPPKRTSRVPR
jgi:hypothetical protein